MRKDLTGVQEGLHAAAGRFDNFLARFDEVVEMLVDHDTEQLRRVASVEQQNDSLLQKYAHLERRLEALEKKAS